VAKLLSRKQFAERIGRSVRHLDRMWSEGSGPPFIRIGSRVIAITEEDAAAWLKARRIVPAGWQGEQPANVLERAEVKAAIDAACADAVAKALEGVAKGRRAQVAT
jgi:predicted DNA-binding transcriptional regulator AlpA